MVPRNAFFLQSLEVGQGGVVAGAHRVVLANEATDSGVRALCSEPLHTPQPPPEQPMTKTRSGSSPMPSQGDLRAVVGLGDELNTREVSFVDVVHGLVGHHEQGGHVRLCQRQNHLGDDRVGVLLEEGLESLLL